MPNDPLKTGALFRMNDIPHPSPSVSRGFSKEQPNVMKPSAISTLSFADARALGMPTMSFQNGRNAGPALTANYVERQQLSLVSPVPRLPKNMGNKQGVAQIVLPPLHETAVAIVPSVPEVKSNMSVKSQNSSDVHLTKWRLRIVTAPPNRTPQCAINCKEWITVEGYRQQEDGDLSKQLWHSSLIHDRVHSRQLKTLSGKSYHLQGDIDGDAMKAEGFSKILSDLFCHGFPDNWSQLLVDFFMKRSQISGSLDSTSAKENSVKPSMSPLSIKNENANTKSNEPSLIPSQPKQQQQQQPLNKKSYKSTLGKNAAAPALKKQALEAIVEETNPGLDDTGLRVISTKNDAVEDRRKRSTQSVKTTKMMEEEMNKKRMAMEEDKEIVRQEKIEANLKKETEKKRAKELAEEKESDHVNKKSRKVKDEEKNETHQNSLVKNSAKKDFRQSRERLSSKMSNIHEDDEIMNLDKYSLYSKTTRSGRAVNRPLQYWRHERKRYDVFGNLLEVVSGRPENIDELQRKRRERKEKDMCDEKEMQYLYEKSENNLERKKQAVDTREIEKLSEVTRNVHHMLVEETGNVKQKRDALSDITNVSKSKNRLNLRDL